MSFNAAHRAYADIVMHNEAARLLKQKRPSTRKAQKASYNATYADDQKLRPDVQKSWWQATAKSTNKMIEGESRQAVRSAYKTLKSQGKLSALTGEGLIVAAAALASGVVAVPAFSSKADISRRTLMVGGAAITATAFFGFASPARADNTDYIDKVKRGVKMYNSQTASSIMVEAYGAGSRG